MKNSYLKLLAKEVLFYSGEPLPKVRFAKIIYFTFKSLVQKNSANYSDLAFIRMPLGPVPDGFMDLRSDHDFGITETNVGLLYNRQLYSLTDKSSFKKSVNSDLVEEIINKLDTFSTSSLIGLSHLDSSWIKYPNGQLYYIDSEDLRNVLPKSGKQIDTVIDNQLIQANLLSGSETDAVVDSTNLEYPDQLDAY